MKKKLIVGGVGMPATLLLDQFADVVRGFFGEEHFPYRVGSSIHSKEWRDVDVRVILSDEEYEQMGFGDPKMPHQNAKWVALVLAFSALGKAMTGLPIDFQIQNMTEANKFEGSRSALGFVPHIYEGFEKPNSNTKEKI